MSFTLLSESEPKAKKSHRCEWCGQAIEQGEKYYRYSAISDGDMQCTKLHLECRDAMTRDIADAADPHDYEIPVEDMVRGKTYYESDEIWAAERKAAGEV